VPRTIEPLNSGYELQETFAKAPLRKGVSCCVSAFIGASPEPFRFVDYSKICDELCSACDHHFLIKPAEEWFLADTNAAAGKPFGDFVSPQIERKGFQFGQQRSPNIAQRMPPPRQILIDDDDPSTWLYDATKLAERSLAILAGLLMQ
jgi:hypothetical protein